MEDEGRRDPCGIAIVEAALILEAGAADRFDRLIVVTCRPKTSACNATPSASRSTSKRPRRGSRSPHGRPDLPDEKKIQRRRLRHRQLRLTRQHRSASAQAVRHPEGRSSVKAPIAATRKKVAPPSRRKSGRRPARRARARYPRDLWQDAGATVLDKSAPFENRKAPIAVTPRGGGSPRRAPISP